MNLETSTFFDGNPTVSNSSPSPLPATGSDEARHRVSQRVVHPQAAELAEGALSAAQVGRELGVGSGPSGKIAYQGTGGYIGVTVRRYGNRGSSGQGDP